MTMESEQSLVDIESAFETAKADRMKAKVQFEAAKGTLHMRLMARRSAGESLTIADMEAIKAAAIDNDDTVKGYYLKFIEADSNYRSAKVKWEAAKRSYWDSKQ